MGKALDLASIGAGYESQPADEFCSIYYIEQRLSAFVNTCARMHLTIAPVLPVLPLMGGTGRGPSPARERSGWSAPVLEYGGYI